MTRPEQQVDQTSGHPVPGMHPLCQFTMEEEELLLNEDGTLPAKRPRKEKIKKIPLQPPPDPEGLARSRDILSKTVPIMAPKVKSRPVQIKTEPGLQSSTPRAKAVSLLKSHATNLAIWPTPPRRQTHSYASQHLTKTTQTGLVTNSIFFSWLFVKKINRSSSLPTLLSGLGPMKGFFC